MYIYLCVCVHLFRILQTRSKEWITVNIYERATQIHVFFIQSISFLIAYKIIAYKIIASEVKNQNRLLYMHCSNYRYSQTQREHVKCRSETNLYLLIH